MILLGFLILKLLRNRALHHSGWRYTSYGVISFGVQELLLSARDCEYKSPSVL